MPGQPIHNLNQQLIIYLQQSPMQSRASTQPHLLNDLTEAHIRSLSQLSPSRITAPWKHLRPILDALNSGVSGIPNCLVYMNVLRGILGASLKDANIRDNRMYGWLGMLYGVRITSIAEGIEGAEGDECLKMVCYGLLLSEMMLSVGEKASRGTTGNRVVYPELYRFVSGALEALGKLGQPDLTSCIYEKSKEQLAMEQEKQQAQNGIRTTEILKYLVQKPTNANKKSTTKAKNPSPFLILSRLIAKCIELVTRSLALCPSSSLKNIYLIRVKINGHLSRLINIQVGTQQIDSVQSLDKESLTGVIVVYLSLFRTKTIEGGAAIDMEEIDEDNKIIQVKELTPRFMDDGPLVELKKLRTKKKKLIKKIESDVRTATMNRLQQHKIIQEVKSERAHKRQKKEMFIMEKQTSEAKKEFNKAKKIKQIRKGSKSDKKPSSKKTRK